MLLLNFFTLNISIDPEFILFYFFSLWSFFSDLRWHISRKKRRAHLSPRACGFKHFCACNLGLVCLIVIGLVRCCVSRAGSLSSGLPRRFCHSGAFLFRMRARLPQSRALCSQEGVPLLCEGHQTHS